MVVMECHKFSFFDKNDECMMRACTRFAVPCIFLATHDDNPYQMKPKLIEKGLMTTMACLGRYHVSKCVMVHHVLQRIMQ